MSVKEVFASLALAAACFAFAQPAKAAESVSAYTTLEEVFAKELFDAFEKDTGIKVNWVRLASGEAVARIEAEKEAQAAMEAARERERQAVDKVDAVAPPVPVAPPAEQETVLRCAFTVYATKTQLRKLKKFLNQEGIRYE